MKLNYNSPLIDNYKLKKWAIIILIKMSIDIRLSYININILLESIKDI